MMTKSRAFGLALAMALATGCLTAPRTRGEKVAAVVWQSSSSAAMIGAGIGITGAGYAGALADPNRERTWQAFALVGLCTVAAGAAVFWMSYNGLIEVIDDTEPKPAPPTTPSTTPAAPAPAVVPAAPATGG